MACGTLILTAAAVLATKANKKFASIATAYMGSNSGPAIYGATAIFTTSNSSSIGPLKVEIYTSSHAVLLTGGTSGRALDGALYTKNSSSPNVYFSN